MKPLQKKDVEYRRSSLAVKLGQIITLIILPMETKVTDQVNANVTLNENDERFKVLSNLTFEGILIHDNGVILDCNPTLERQVGYSHQELLGMQIFDKLIPPKFHGLIRQKMMEASTHYEAEAIHKNGAVIPISIESIRTKIENKYVRVAAIRNLCEFQKTIHELDIYKNLLEEKVRERTEELKKQSMELQQQNDILQFERNQLRTIIDNIPDLIYIKDKDSKFLNANKRAIKLFRQKQLSDVTGKTDFDFFNPQYANGYFADEQKIVKTGLPIIGREELCINEDDKQIYLSTTKVPLMNKACEIIGIVGIGRDITEKVIAENKLKVQTKTLEESNILLAERKEELETTLEQLKKTQSHLIQSEKMASLGILVAGIAHEINNPVNFIYAGVNSIIKDFEDIKVVVESLKSIEKNSQDIIALLTKIEDLKKKYEFELAYSAITETLQDIKLGANRIKEIVEGLSRFSRIENENWKKANIHEEIDNVLILLKNKYKHHIRIIKDYDNSLPLVECYPGKLNQVFMNIINNAIDAIEKENGDITIKTSLSSDAACISVKDTGRGIKDDDKLRVFDPFFTTKEVGYGLGLGLAISYSIVQEHKGSIKVNSTVNEGAEFIIRIPLSQSKTIQLTQ
jgi:PAS domain S-box-containing protein